MIEAARDLLSHLVDERLGLLVILKANAILQRSVSTARNLHNSKQYSR